MAIYSDDLEFPAVGALSGTFTFDTPGIGDEDTVDSGIIPGGSIITDAFLTVTEAFNASGENVLCVGTDDDKTRFVCASSVSGDLPAQSWRSVSSGIGYVVPRGGQRVFATYEQSGDPATTGAAHFAVTFVPPRKRFR